jgi:hypothetical protein
VVVRELVGVPMTEDEGGALFFGVMFGLLFGIVGTGILTGLANQSGHRQLGSSGYVCFANHTCRDGLRCIVVDGHPDGICSSFPANMKPLFPVNP